MIITPNNLREFLLSKKLKVLAFCSAAYKKLGYENFSDLEIVCSRRYRIDTLINKKIKTFHFENKNDFLLHQKFYLGKAKNKSVFLKESFSADWQNFVQEKNIRLIGHLAKFKKFENKLFFLNLIKKFNLPSLPTKVGLISDWDYQKIRKIIGKKFIIQRTDISGGGKGTFFINNEKEFEECQNELVQDDRKQSVIIKKLIEGPSISLVSYVSRSAIFCTYPQFQILAKRDGNTLLAGFNIGHDFAEKIDEKIAKQAIAIAGKIGKFLQQKKYEGFFGVDFVVDDKTLNVYPVEINPRFTASRPTLTAIQEKKWGWSLLDLNIMTSLFPEIELDLAKFKKIIEKPLNLGSQYFVINPVDNKKINQVKPGIYELINGDLKFKKESFDFKDLKNSNQVLITGENPIESNIKGHRRLALLIFPGKIFDSKTCGLLYQPKKIINEVKNKFLD